MDCRRGTDHVEFLTAAVMCDEVIIDNTEIRKSSVLGPHPFGQILPRFDRQIITTRVEYEDCALSDAGGEFQNTISGVNYSEPISSVLYFGLCLASKLFRYGVKYFSEIHFC